MILLYIIYIYEDTYREREIDLYIYICIHMIFKIVCYVLLYSILTYYIIYYNILYIIYCSMSYII